MQLHQRFIETAKKNSKKTAVHDHATQKAVTYQKLLMASLAFSRRLAAIPDDYVGIMLPASAGCMIASIATLFAGRTPVMINYSAGPADSVAFTRKKCGFNTVITSKRFLEKLKLEPSEGMVFMEDIAEDMGLREKISAFLKSMLCSARIKKTVHSGSVDEDAVILLTTGSEDFPKAVRLSHKNIMHNVNAVPHVLNMTPDEIFITNLPLFHSFGFTVEFWLPILYGFTVVASPNPLDYKAVCDLVKKHGVTFLAASSTFFYGYLRKSKPDDFTSIKIAVAGAEKLPGRLRELFLKKRGITIYEGYGVTETSPALSVNTPEHHKPGSVGRLLPGVSVKICETESRRELPCGREGGILVKGDLVMSGYLNDPEKTAKAITDGWYDTGDMGMMDEDGFLWHRGRRKRFVKIGGEMVSLPRLENVLSNLLPQGVACCVVDAPDPAKGSVIVAAVDGEVDSRRILKLMSRELPPHSSP